MVLMGLAVVGINVSVINSSSFDFFRTRNMMKERFQNLLAERQSQLSDKEKSIDILTDSIKNVNAALTEQLKELKRDLQDQERKLKNKEDLIDDLRIKLSLCN
jgi:chromosome segregation ATPase